MLNNTQRQKYRRHSKLVLMVAKAKRNDSVSVTRYCPSFKSDYTFYPCTSYLYNFFSFIANTFHVKEFHVKETLKPQKSKCIEHSISIRR